MCKVIKNFLSLVTIIIFTGCSSNKEIPEEGSLCPKITIAKNTHKKIVFDGLGTDDLNQLYKAEIMGYDGKCEYNKKTKELKLKLTTEFNVELGVANKSNHIDFDYFLAIPAFYPQPAGKQKFTVSLDFKKGSDNLNFKDNEVEITFPPSETLKTKDLEIYLGLQLTEAELKYNRQNQNYKEQ